MNRFEFKAALSVSDAGEITGVAWPFGSPDMVGDVIEKGAFAFNDRLPMLFAHDQAQAVGVWDDISETNDGLQVKGRLLVNDVARAREVRALIQEKAVTGLSIGFETKAATGRPKGGRTIRSLVLHEISIVSVPSHPQARIQTIKELKLDDDQNDSALAERVTTLETDIASIRENLGNVEKAATRIETKLARPGAAVETKAGDDAAIERKAFGTYLRLGNQTPLDDMKALVVSSDPQAGYLAPAEVSSEFIRDLIEFSPIRAVASVRSTSAPSVKYPRRTGITNAQWEDELEDSEESDVTFGQLEIPTAKLTTFVDISNELLADSAGAAEAEVRLALAEDFGQKEAVGFVKGSGIKQPEGLMTNTEITSVINGHATNLNTDKLIDLLYSMPAAYRNASGARWAMNGTTLAAVRKLKNATTGEYIWQPAIAAGQPETILGKPVLEMVDLDDIGDGKFPIIFGDFSAYRILDRLALSVLSDPYTQARRGVTRIHATRRVGARVLQAARFRKLKTATA